MLLGATGSRTAHALDLMPLRINDCVGIELTGEIRLNEAAEVIKRIDAAVEKCGRRNLIVGDMPGGSVNDALAIGAAIRERGYVTAVHSSSKCYSACGLVFLGGVQRYWRPGARFIIHRPRIYGAFPDAATETAAYEELRTRLIRYVSSMGANPDYVDAMYDVQPRSFVEVRPPSLRAWSVFTTEGVPF
jgi:hypothetical protein